MVSASVASYLTSCWLTLFGLTLAPGAPVDVAPFGTPLPGESGIVWEDPREIHRVVVRFQGAAPSADQVHLEYWGSRWPEQRLPKDRELGGGALGWWDLGDWFAGGWRAADTDATSDGSAITFTFRPVNAREFPQLLDFPATFRTTMKIRVTSDAGPLTAPQIQGIEAYTDSVWEQRTVRLVWREVPGEPDPTVFNGSVEEMEHLSPRSFRVRLWSTANPDPNTYDRTLITVRGPHSFTFSVADLDQGALFLPQYGAAVLAGEDDRDYDAVAAAQKAQQGLTLYERVVALPEQTWQAAWEGMPPKRSFMYLPMGLEGGRQRFRLDADGSVSYRTNNQYLYSRPGRDTPRVLQDGRPLRFGFGLPEVPTSRTIEAGSLPIGHTTWEVKGVQVEQTAFVTTLSGTQVDDAPPPGDAFAVFLAGFTFTNPTDVPRTATLRLRCDTNEAPEALVADTEGMLWSGDRLRGQVVAGGDPEAVNGFLQWSWVLAPGESRSAVVKLPYLLLSDAGEWEDLAGLDRVVAQ